VLAAALRADGHQPILIPLTAPDDFEAAAQVIVRERPEAVGISIAYEGSAWLLAALPRRLRQLDFTGPIVAGGPFATLHAEDLLSAARDLDGVIRHDGEKAIVRLAEAVIGHCGMETVPGIVLRTAQGVKDGAICDFSRVDVWPYRSPLGLPKHLDLPTADMIASRGCDRSCAYCSVAALRADAGRRRSVLEEIGLGSSVRRRPVQDVANEIATLAFEYGARVFQFQDDTFLPDDQQEAVTFVRALRAELQAEGVPRFAFTVKLRADQVTRDVCTELSNLGVIRTFVGIEALSRSMSQRIGRRSSSIPARVALGRLRRLGIASYFNSLAIGPEATWSDLEEEIEALSSVRGVPFEIVRLVAYGGTAVARRLRDEGRLKGCAFLRTYDYTDERVAALADAMSHIATRHFGKRCPAKRVVDLTYNIALARRFYDRARLAPIERTAARLVARVNADQVNTMQALMSVLGRKPDLTASPVEEIVTGAMVRDIEICRTIEEVVTVLEHEVQAAGADRPHAYFRGQVTAPLVASAVMAFAGCGGTTSLDGVGGGDAGADIALDSIFDVDEDDESDTAVMDAPADLFEEEKTSCETYEDTLCLEPHPPSAPAVSEVLAFESDLMHPCGEYGYFKATVEVNDQACGQLVELVGATGSFDPAQSVFQCVADLLSNYDLSCFSGQTVVFEDPGPLD